MQIAVESLEYHLRYTEGMEKKKKLNIVEAI